MLTVSKMFNSSLVSHRRSHERVLKRGEVSASSFAGWANPWPFRGKSTATTEGFEDRCIHPSPSDFCHRCQFIRMLGRMLGNCNLHHSARVSGGFSIDASIGMIGCLHCRKWFAFHVRNYDAMIILMPRKRLCRKRLCIFDSEPIWHHSQKHPMCEEFGRNGYCCGTHYSPRRGDWSLGLSKCPATEGSPNWFDSSRIKRQQAHLQGAMQTVLDPCKCGSCFLFFHVLMFESFIFFSFVEFFLLKKIRGHGTTSGTMAVRIVIF